ncbi:hypothetical protein JYT28_01790 [Desulfobulbus sp. AH-315-M07]|nr:hypothetical protein [Desulfobulbus sp. AH-315-M07]
MRGDDQATKLQRFMLFFMPRRWKAAAIEESRQWQRRCRKCNGDHSVWDSGGIRFKASGNKREYAVCPLCDASGWLVLHHPKRAPL